MIKYLKGLDTLRAIAALVVVWGHVELLKVINRSENVTDASNIDLNIPSRHIAVILFFVISGFLITYLLVKEKEKNGNISFKKFYLRRILRIWPLYYIVILLSFLFFKADYTPTSAILCLTIFPNIAHAIGEGWSTSPQIWSIGVEEQFYLFWPLILAFLPVKRITLFIILFFIGYSLLPHVIAFINVRTLQSDDLSHFVNKFFYGTKFNCMAIGALIGFLYAKKSKVLHYIRHKVIAYSSIVLSVALWGFGFEMAHFTDEFFSILFAIALYNIVDNPRIHIDTKISSFIGKISYGIYMYHWIIMLFAFKFIPLSENSFLYNLSLYTFVFGGTILISWLSYISIEKYFLDIKKRFETK